MTETKITNPNKALRGTSDWYDRDYFEVMGVHGSYSNFDTTLPFYQGYAQMIDITFGISGKTTLDIGCAKGVSVQTYFERGALAYGTDISEYLEQAAPEVIRGACWTGDVGRLYRQWTARKPEGTPKEFFLVTCVECLEHIFPWRVPTALTNIARSTGKWFYSTIPVDNQWDQNLEHVCIRPERWWREQITRYCPNLRQRDDMEQLIKRVHVADSSTDGIVPYKTWGWRPFIYENRHISEEAMDSVVAQSTALYDEGEALYEQGLAVYDGSEVLR